MKIYLATSWRNVHHKQFLEALRESGHEVYDFKNPFPDDRGFRWNEINPHYDEWTAQQFVEALSDPVAEHGFLNDWEAMCWADTGVLLLPCGRSAHLEAGYFAGAQKKLLIHIGYETPVVPELMYKMADSIHLTWESLRDRLNVIQDPR